MYYFRFILLFAALAAFYVFASAAETIETRIRTLEAELSAAAMSEDYARMAEIKTALEPLYDASQASRNDERRRNPLDQGGDNCFSAVTIPSIPFCDIGTTLGYTGDYAGDCAASGAPDVVYRYVTAADERVTFSLCGSTYDALLHIWQGCPTSGGIQVACVDDFCGLQPCITLMLEGDYEYFIVVDGYSANAGAYIFNAVPENIGCIATTCGWANDDCEEATMLTTTAQITGSTIGATLDFPPGGSNCGVPDGPGVWYKFAGQDSNVVIELSGATVPHQMFLYCGCCTDLFCLLQTDCSIPSGYGVGLEAGVTYWLLVAGCDGEQGTFDLHIEYDSPSVNGGCGIAMDHDFTAPGEVSGSTCGQCNWCGLRPSEDALARVHLPYDGNWVFSLCSSSFDTYLFLGAETCGGIIYARDDTCGLQSTTPCMSLDAGTYFVMIEAWSSLQCGEYVLRVNPCPLPQPLELVIQPQYPNILLSWTPPNGAAPANYFVYRATEADLIPHPANLIGTTSATNYIDPNVLVNPNEKYHYIVTANAP